MVLYVWLWLKLIFYKLGISLIGGYKDAVVIAVIVFDVVVGDFLFVVRIVHALI